MVRDMTKGSCVRHILVFALPMLLGILDRLWENPRVFGLKITGRVGGFMLF